MIQISNPVQESEILQGLSKITNWIEGWAVVLTAIGTVSMALLQTAKNAFPLRAWFQRHQMRKWLQDAAKDCQKSTKPEVCASTAENDLIGLAASGDDRAFYNQPIEDLCTQIRNVVPVIMDYPELHTHLLLCLTSEARVEDIQTLLNPPSHETFLKRADQSSHEEKRLIREFAAAKTRLTAQLRCSIDAIQMSIGFRWKYLLQLSAIILSGAIAVASLISGVIPGQRSHTVGEIIIIGILSGFLAPVARDLVAAVEKWRS